MEARQYRALSLTVDPRTMQYKRRGDVITAPDGHTYNPDLTLLEVPTSLIVHGHTLTSSARNWEPVDP